MKQFINNDRKCFRSLVDRFTRTDYHVICAMTTLVNKR